MILLDSYALIAFLAGERAAPEVRALLRSGDCALSTAQLAETLDVLVRVLGADRRHVDRVLDPLLLSEIDLVDVGEPEARGGASLRHRHYRRSEAELSLADCLLLATAVLRGATVATSDPPLAVATRNEQLRVEALPDRQGRLP